MTLAIAAEAVAPDSVRAAPGTRLRDDVLDAAPSLRSRIASAALECVARQGLAKTTVDDIAREARCSRASVYRLFRGGKDEVLAVAVETEVERFFAALTETMREAHGLEDAIVACMVEGVARLDRHRALSYVVEHEPEVILPSLAFARLDDLLARVGSVVAPNLERWLTADDALRAGEWLARVALAYMACPADDVDMTEDAGARALVRSFVLPLVWNALERCDRVRSAVGASAS